MSLLMDRRDDESSWRKKSFEARNLPHIPSDLRRRFRRVIGDFRTEEFR